MWLDTRAAGAGAEARRGNVRRRFGGLSAADPFTGKPETTNNN